MKIINMFQISNLSRGTLIRIDDIAENMNWRLMDKCEKLFHKYKIKPLLGVVPKNQDPNLLKFPKEKDFWNRVRNWQAKDWEISMHGYSHDYVTDTQKKDFLKLGGKSEFYGVSLEDQIQKIKKGLEIFNQNGVRVRSFFAPNHTYDLNTFRALKECKIKIVVDGYGIQPYHEYNLIFIPQLFYRLFLLPFSFQTTQLHINEWSDENFEKFEKFVVKNHKKIISCETMIQSVSDNFLIKIINQLTKFTLITYRKIKN